MTRLFARCLVLLLVASLCFASFTIGASAADGIPAVSATWSDGVSSSHVTLSLGDSQYFVKKSYSQSAVVSCSVSLPSAGTLSFSLLNCSSSFSGAGVSYTVSGSSVNTTTVVTVVSSSAVSFSLSVSPRYISFVDGFNSARIALTLVSWEPSSDPGGGGGGSGDSSGNSILGPSQGGMDIWNSDGSINGDQRNDIESTSERWNINSTYIGQLDHYITGDESTYETSVWISKMLANLSYTTWSWKYDETTGNFLYVRPNPGSWLDNMWQMNIYLYYNLANQKGWFGHINSEFATLNNRVLQILSVLANDEDVKIKDATTDHRNWITDYFEDSSGSSGKPQTSDNDAVNDSMNEVRDQFQSDYSAGDIGSIFSASSYDNNLWYSFWSQSVSDDVNGTSRGGMGGGRARAQSNSSRWADRYNYGDDTIVDMFGFGGADDG